MTLSFFAKQHAHIFGLQLLSSYTLGEFIELKYCATEEDYHAQNFLPTKVTRFAEVLEDILAMPALQALEVGFEDMYYAPAKKFMRELKRLKGLRFLHIYSQQMSYESGFEQIVIDGMPLLEKLQLKLIADVDIKIALPCLRELVLYRNIIDIEKTLSQLNPETLTTLSLRGCARYANTKIARASIGKFIKLKSLNLSSNKLKILDFNILDLSELEQLDLSDNANFDLTESFIALDTLKKLSISKTKTVKHKYLKTGSDLLEIIKDCKENEATFEQRQLLFELLQNPTSAYKKITLQKFGELYPVVNFLQLHQQLLALLETLVTASLSNLYKEDPAIEVCITGKLQGVTNKEAEDKMKQYGIKAVKKITENTTITCIGQRANAEIVQQVIQQNLPFCTPIYLKRFLDELEIPYLVEAETEVHTNLENLLQSTELENRLLALQLMKNGGIPDHILPYLCLEIFYENAFCKHEILLLLRKYIANEEYLFLENAYKKQKDEITTSTINYLLAGKLFTEEWAARAIVKFYKPTKKQILDAYDTKNAFYFKFASKILTRSEACAQIIWQTYFDEATSTLDLLWYKTDLKKLPKSFFGNPKVKRVLRYISNSLQELPSIKAWENLESYVIYCSPYHASRPEMQRFEQALPTQVKLTFVTL